jgi:hypothetical protein
MRHEAIERCEAADAEHDEIALLARGDAYRTQRARPCALGRKRLAGGHQRLERSPPMRVDQAGH